jgi:two-component system NtrC family sensor kinase
MAHETILVVDDNKEIVAALTDVLKTQGYQVLSALDGRRGLHVALDKHPDLILLDWNLPELSGLQVLQALRDRGNTAPVVLMTIYGSENVAVQAFRLGIRDYIPKPLRIPETLAATAVNGVDHPPGAGPIGHVGPGVGQGAVARRRSCLLF